MELVIKADASLSVEGGNVVFRTYDVEGETTFKDEQSLYELVHEFAQCFTVPGTDQIKLNAEDIQEWTELASELRDALLLVETVLGDHN